jgi:hypothetical protein
MNIKIEKNKIKKILLHSLAITIGIFVLLFSIFILNKGVRAADYLANPSFTGGSTSWSLSVSTYDSAIFQDTAGSVTTNASGSGTNSIGTATQTIGTSISASDLVSLTAYTRKAALGNRDCSVSTVSVEIEKPSNPGTWVTIWTDATVMTRVAIPSWSGPSALDVSSYFTETGTYGIRTYANVTSGGHKNAICDAWFDNLTLDVTPVDLTWVTGSADFKIYESGSLSWGTGTLICSGTLTDDNAGTIPCSSGSFANSTQYRVDVLLKDVGAQVNMNGAGDYVDHIAVKGGFSGTNPTLGNCAFYDVETDNGSTTCTAAWNATNDVRITNTGGGNVVIGATTGTEGFMYLITTDADVPTTNATSYLNTSIDGNAEDSSKITISGPSAGGYESSGTYTSSWLDMTNNSPVQIISWSETVPGGCDIRLQVQTAPDSGGSPGVPTGWYGASGAGTYFTDPLGTIIPAIINGNQWVQYKAELTGDGISTPILEEVVINYK